MNGRVPAFCAQAGERRSLLQRLHAEQAEHKAERLRLISEHKAERLKLIYEVEALMEQVCQETPHRVSCWSWWSWFHLISSLRGVP